MYKIIDDMRVLRLSDEAVIPVSTDNMDYIGFLSWKEDGGVPQPADPVAPSIPQQVSRYQARAALLEAGLLSDVEAYFASLPSDSLEKLAWQEAPTVTRASQALAAAASALGLTDEGLDELFLRAATFL